MKIINLAKDIRVDKFQKKKKKVKITNRKLSKNCNITREMI